MQRRVLLGLLVSGAALGRRATGAPTRVRRVAVLPAEARNAEGGAIAHAIAHAGSAPLDASWVSAAARGAGYGGSRNLTLAEAKRLAATVGADILLLVDRSLVERASDNDSLYWDGFAGLFFVDGASGRLARYAVVRSSAPTREEAGARLAAAVEERVREAIERFDAIVTALEALLATTPEVELDLVTSPALGKGEIEPRFFRRPSPVFTDDAERAHVVATVDVAVTFLADGQYGPFEILRWAGYGLDESVVDAIRAEKFWPARRDGRHVSARALLRYNFRYRVT